MACLGNGCRALSTLFLACLVQVWAGVAAASDGTPRFELGSELLVTDVGAARLVGYGTVGERSLELQVAAVSANVRVLVVAPDGLVVPFLGSFADGRLVLLLADGGFVDVADQLARDDRDLVFVLADGRRVLVPVEGRERAPLDAAPRSHILQTPATTPSPWPPDEAGGDDGSVDDGNDADDDRDDDGDEDDGTTDASDSETRVAR